jgi:hypothetical protein
VSGLCDVHALEHSDAKHTVTSLKRARVQPLLDSFVVTALPELPGLPFEGYWTMDMLDAAVRRELATILVSPAACAAACTCAAAGFQERALNSAMCSDAILLCSSVLNAHADDAVVQEAACLLLIACSTEGTGWPPSVLSRGVLPQLRAVLDCQNAAAATAALALANLCSARIVRSQVVASGCVSRVLSLMSFSEADEFVQYACLRALASITLNVVDNQKAVLALEGLRCVYAALERFGSSARVFQQACSVLANLAFTDEAEAVIASSHGARRLIGTLERHVGDVASLESACRALHRLSFSSAGREALTHGAQVLTRLATEFNDAGLLTELLTGLQASLL